MFYPEAVSPNSDPWHLLLRTHVFMNHSYWKVFVIYFNTLEQEKVVNKVWDHCLNAWYKCLVAYLI